MQRLKLWIWLIGTFLLVVMTVLIAAIPAKAIANALPSDPPPPRVTVVWSPHPDDETLRLTSYTLAARDHGDVLILAAVTDGGASGVKDRLGITSQQMMNMRISEQTEAWYALTYGRGRIIRLGLPDGGVTGLGMRAAFDRVQKIAESYHAPIEHYVAASLKDAHPDHRIVADTVYRKAAVAHAVCRFSLDPLQTGSGATYVSEYQLSAEGAHQAYDQIGIISVAPLFKALHDHRHFSRIIPPPPVIISPYSLVYKTAWAYP